MSAQHRCTISAHAVITEPADLGSVALTAAAATACLERAGLEPDAVDLLINCGIYRDDNIIEPAMAALIQKRVGINRDPSRFPVASVAHSFDLMNSSVGVLNALQVVDAQMRVGRLDHALVVAGDCHPSGRPQPGFPYRHAGAAFLLRRSSEGRAGFEAHASGSVQLPSYGRWGYNDTGAWGDKARQAAEVEEDEAGLVALELAAVERARAFMAQHAVHTEGLVVLPSALSQGFSVRLAAGLGLDPGQVMDPFAAQGDTHSASPVAAYALADGLEQAPRCLLFVAAGSGPSVGCSLYRS
jgi:3-oxoacyl-[acyl-carrier-protein] synthase-3